VYHKRDRNLRYANFAIGALKGVESLAVILRSTQRMIRERSLNDMTTRGRGQQDVREPEAERAREKRPYKKPEVRSERVFETMALACGKIRATQAQCRFNRKRS